VEQAGAKDGCKVRWGEGRRVFCNLPAHLQENSIVLGRRRSLAVTRTRTGDSKGWNDRKEAETQAGPQDSREVRQGKRWRVRCNRPAHPHRQFVA
jgi:hypothetical protein